MAFWNLWRDTPVKGSPPFPPTHSPTSCQGHRKPKRKGTVTGTPEFPTTHPVVADRVVPGQAWPLTQLGKSASFLGKQFLRE